jgi:hypothetical protein
MRWRRHHRRQQRRAPAAASPQPPRRQGIRGARVPPIVVGSSEEASQGLLWGPVGSSRHGGLNAVAAHAAALAPHATFIQFCKPSLSWSFDCPNLGCAAAWETRPRSPNMYNPPRQNRHAAPAAPRHQQHQQHQQRPCALPGPCTRSASNKGTAATTSSSSGSRASTYYSSGSSSGGALSSQRRGRWT